MEARYHSMLMGRSGAERMVMGCAMFDDARRMVEASIRAINPDIDEVALRQALFLHFYGHEFDPEQRRRILAGIAEAYRRSQKTSAG
jgi:hypothetical protein